MSDTFRAIITKYATTSGVFEEEAKLVTYPPECVAMKMISVQTQEIGTICYMGNDWHRTKESALADVRKRFERKHLSLNKQLNSLADKAREAIEEIEVKVDEGLTVVSWTTPPQDPNDEYEIYRDGVLIQTVSSSARSYADGMAVPGQAHVYQVFLIL